eukprot:5810035-Alexandrium_andersonii.AAC.1
MPARTHGSQPGLGPPGLRAAVCNLLQSLHAPARPVQQTHADIPRHQRGLTRSSANTGTGTGADANQGTRPCS